MKSAEMILVHVEAGRSIRNVAENKNMKSKMRNKKPVVVAVSGGFDPIHIGHVRMIQEAKKLGDKLIVILNNDNWLRKKKGYVFMSEHEREEIIKAIKEVDGVVVTSHSKKCTDKSVCNELRKIKPDIFANGGDRVEDNVPEVAVCKEIGCKMIFGIGTGGKVQSSSWLLKEFIEIFNVQCPCGSGKKYKECHGKK